MSMLDMTTPSKASTPSRPYHQPQTVEDVVQQNINTIIHLDKAARAQRTGTDRIVDAITAIAAPRRREILRLIWDRELSAGDIAAQLPVTFGAVSQHLSVLRDAGIVDVRQQGTYRYYRANQERIGPLAAVLEAYWTDALDRLAVEAEREAADAT